MDIRPSDQRERYYKKLFIGKTITGVELYQVNENYMELEEDVTWVIDCGATIRFEQEEQISLGWDAELEIFRLSEMDVEDLTNELEVYELPLSNNENLQALIGQKVSDMRFVWNYFEDMDGEQEFVPCALAFILENGKSLTWATVNCDVEEGEVKSISFDLEGELLVSLDEEMVPNLGLQEIAEEGE